MAEKLYKNATKSTLVINNRLTLKRGQIFTVNEAWPKNSKPTPNQVKEIHDTVKDLAVRGWLVVVNEHGNEVTQDEFESIAGNEFIEEKNKPDRSHIMYRGGIKKRESFRKPRPKLKSKELTPSVSNGLSVSW